MLRCLLMSMILLSVPHLRASPMEIEPIGLNLYLKKTSLPQEEIRISVYRGLGFIRAFQSEEMGFEFIVPKDKSTLSRNSNYDSLCGEYKKLVWVQSCGIEYRSRRSD